MNRLITSALVSLCLAGATLGAGTPASAAADFSISLGNAAFAYSDGYWDRDHHWHAWRNRAESEYFRSHFGEHYVNTRHDRDRRDHDQGWRGERWWDHDEHGDHDRH